MEPISCGFQKRKAECGKRKPGKPGCAERGALAIPRSIDPDGSCATDGRHPNMSGGARPPAPRFAIDQEAIDSSGERFPKPERSGVSAFRFPLSAFLILLVAAVALSSGCAHRGRSSQPTTPQEPVSAGKTERGIASWYGEPYHGRQTASGEIYDMHRLTAAHRTLPFGTVVRVTRRDTGDTVEVRINDRGPFIEGRIIDLSYAAARRIGLDVDGIAPVEVKILKDRRPAEVERPPPKTPSSPSAATECWWVQVGAFGDRGNARRAEKKLEAAGEIAIVMESGDGLYRVRVGPVDSREEAEEARRRILTEWPQSNVVDCG